MTSSHPRLYLIFRHHNTIRRRLQEKNSKIPQRFRILSCGKRQIRPRPLFPGAGNGILIARMIRACKEVLPMSVVEYRRQLHRIPELDNQLPETTAYVRSVLEPLG